MKSTTLKRLTFIHAGAVEDFGLPDGVPVLFALRLEDTCNNRARGGKTKRREKSSENEGGAPDAAGHCLTFQDNLQLVPQNVEDAVTGAGFRDDVAFQPSPACVLVEIITRLHRRIHVLQEPSGFETQKKRGWGGHGGQDDRESHVERKSVLQGTGAMARRARTLPLTCCDAVRGGAHGGQAGVEQLSFSHKNTLLC